MSRLNGLLTLTMPRDNSANWVASWTAAQSQPATKSVKHRKRFCFCHVLKKDLGLRMNGTKSIMQTFRIFPTKTTGLNTRYSFEADDRQSTRERTLSGPWPPVALDVSRRSCFIYVSLPLFPLSHVPYDCVITGFGIISNNLWECCPCGCTLWSRGSWLGGALVSALCFCWFLAHRFLYGIVVVFLFLLFVLPLPYQSLGDTKLSSFLYIARTMNWSADHQPCCLVFCLFLCALFCFLFSLSAFLFLHGDRTMDYVSIQSVLFWLHTVDRTEVATDLIRWICKMQLYFRFVKRPGESHLALDGKNASRDQKKTEQCNAQSWQNDHVFGLSSYHWMSLRFHQCYDDTQIRLGICTSSCCVMVCFCLFLPH